jgi:hypothetical protein
MHLFVLPLIPPGVPCDTICGAAPGSDRCPPISSANCSRLSCTLSPSSSGQCSVPPSIRREQTHKPEPSKNTSLSRIPQAKALKVPPLKSVQREDMEPSHSRQDNRCRRDRSLQSGRDSILFHHEIVFVHHQTSSFSSISQRRMETTGTPRRFGFRLRESPQR